MEVTLLNHMGSDLTVVDAARVSFSKQSEYVHDPFEDVYYLNEKDQKLIKYLAEHKHWTPFGHCFVSFRVKAPLFVARQLGKHQVGLVWNEVSRRYVDGEPEFAFPVMRQRADNVKQGSSNEFPVELEKCEQVYLYAQNVAEQAYLYLLKQNVAPEVARMVLPQSMYTEWIWSGSLAAFARVCKLRLDPHTQKETREIAEQISNHMQRLFPHSWSALCTY